MKFLGVEGGGTKTVAWIAARSPDGCLEILGQGTSGPSNPQAVGWDQTLDNLSQAIHEARAEAQIRANLTNTPLAAAALTMAGVDRPQEAEQLTTWVKSQGVADRVVVTNDSLGLLAVGTTNNWGIALVAGTGSIAYGQTPSGESTRTGGWGYLLGDEGSAYAIALSGLKSAVRAADGRGNAHRLLADFLARLNLNQPDDLLEAMYLSERDRAWIASLADVVTNAAEMGDAPAIGILNSAAEELAELILATARKLKLETQPIPLCFTGGLILNTPLVQTHVLEVLSKHNLHPAAWIPVHDPVWGALKLAEQLLSAQP